MPDDASRPEGEADTVAAGRGPTATELDASDVDDVADYDAADYDAADSEEKDADSDDKPARPRMSPLRLATAVGLVLVLGLGGLVGWLGFRAYESHQADEQRKLFLQVGRQGALNLTTIDWQQVDSDVQRILDSATGTFYEDFQRRVQPFVEVVKQAKSKSVGTVSEAGLESVTENGAQVLVAVSVETSNAGAPEQRPRSWPMRISVQKMGDEAKVSNVAFVA